MRIIALVFLIIVLSGCGHGLMQSAKTVKKGEVKVTIGQMVISNEARESQVIVSTPSELDLRFGLHKQVDGGVKLFFLKGALADAKVNFLPDEWNSALAFSAGFGYAIDPIDNTATIKHLPLKLIASHKLGAATPYAGFEYGFWWINGRKYSGEEEIEEGFEPVKKTWHGDIVLKYTGGLEFAINSNTSIFLEYTFFNPWIDDGSDNYVFVENHIAGAGIRF